MRDEGMNGLVRGRHTRTTIPAKTGAIRATDLLNRCFSSPRPNHAWVTETVALHGLSASIGSVGDAYDNAAAESTIGLYKNEAVAAGSPFRTGPLRNLSDVETLTMNYVHWYGNERLHSQLGNVTPEEYEQAYYATTGSPSGDAANKKTA